MRSAAVDGSKTPSKMNGTILLPSGIAPKGTWQSCVAVEGVRTEASDAAHEDVRLSRKLCAFSTLSVVAKLGFDEAIGRARDGRQ